MIHEFILFTNMITQQLFTIAYLLQKNSFCTTFSSKLVFSCPLHIKRVMSCDNKEYTVYVWLTCFIEWLSKAINHAAVICLKIFIVLLLAIY